jgi:hypothetical protein
MHGTIPRMRVVIAIGRGEYGGAAAAAMDRLAASG